MFSGSGVFLAIDAGGTHTHALVLLPDGTVVGAGRAGGGSPTHSHDARAQVEAAIDRALCKAGAAPAGVTLVAGGFAGINRSTGQQWAQGWFPTLTCPRILVNDAVTAHAGAFQHRAGVIVIAGTGSIIATLGGSGELIDSGMFEHYAGGARHLVFEVVRRVLIGDSDRGDPIVAALFAHWQVADRHGLRTALLSSRGEDRQDIKRRHGAFAPTVTALAEVSPLADAALTWLCNLTAVGVRLLQPVAGRSADRIREKPNHSLRPSDRSVPVARIGALAESTAYGDRLAHALDGRARIVTSKLGSLGGAAAFTLSAAGIDLDEAVLERLRSGVSAAMEPLS